MSPVERLQAAIEKLEQAKEATAHWHTIGGASEWVMLLWRTIDAQLAILQFGVKRLRAVQTLTGLHVQAHEHEMALADAILGSDQ